MYHKVRFGRKNMKKQLLKESEIRRMMKFANIGSLSDPFVDKLNEMAMYDEEEPMMEEEGDEEELEGSPPEVDAEADPEPEVDPEPELDAEPELADAEGGTTVEAGLEGLNAFLEAAMAHPDEIREKVQVEMADDADAMADPMGDDPVALDAELPGPEGEAGDAEPLPPGDEEADDMQLEQELEEADLQLQEDDEFVNEVVRRVAKRLLKK
mgnify:CR=1 FL=1|tara:strand:- start:8044 stop:8676 length:633 start_codon:yes stop_codon:yes gene_type:complete